MKRLHSLTAVALTGMVGFTSICAPLAARASEEGKRNTAIGLGIAATALLLTQRNKVPGLVVAGGAAIALSQADRDRCDPVCVPIRDDHDRDRGDDRGRDDRRDNRDGDHGVIRRDR